MYDSIHKMKDYKIVNLFANAHPNIKKQKFNSRIISVKLHEP